MNDIEDLLCENLGKRTRWDQSPELRMILSEDDGSPRIGISLLPESMWQRGRVPDVLNFAADSFSNLSPDEAGTALSLRDGSGCQGVFLFSETYMVPVPLNNIAAKDQIDAQAKDHKLYKHPDRVKMRMIWAFMADGREICVGQERGGQIKVLTDGLGDGPVEGTVPEQMRRLRDFLCDRKIENGRYSE